LGGKGEERGVGTFAAVSPVGETQVSVFLDAGEAGGGGFFVGGGFAGGAVAGARAGSGLFCGAVGHLCVERDDGNHNVVYDELFQQK